MDALLFKHLRNAKNSSTMATIERVPTAVIVMPVHASLLKRAFPIKEAEGHSLWRQLFIKPKQPTLTPHLLSTLGCRPSFWHKEDRTLQAHHCRVHSWHSTLYNSNIVEVNPI